MDGGAWWAAVHGVAKSWTRLSDFTFTFHQGTVHQVNKEAMDEGNELYGRSMVMVFFVLELRVGLATDRAPQFPWERQNPESRGQATVFSHQMQPEAPEQYLIIPLTTAK